MAVSEDATTGGGGTRRVDKFLVHAPLLASIGLTAALALILGVFSTVAEEGHWGKTKNKTNYCEGVDKESNVRQPMNAWSNLAYVAAGGWALGRAAQMRFLQCYCTIQEEAAQQTVSYDWIRWCGISCSKAVAPLPVVLVALLGLSMIALGWGSFMFHAAMTRPWQQMDVGAMYWVMNAALAVTLWRWLIFSMQTIPKWQCLLSLILFVVLIADAVMLALKWKLSATVVFNAQLGVVILSEIGLLIVPAVLFCAKRRRRLDRRLVRLASLGVCSFLAGVLGLVFRQTGVRESKREQPNTDFCHPENIFQPHAVWHLLTGLALLLLSELQLLLVPLSSVMADTACRSKDESESQGAVIGIAAV